MQLFLVGAGGFLGALSRFWIGSLITQWSAAARFPFATFAINVTGCLLIGFASELPIIRDHNTRFLMITGFLGAYTTFSTFGNETVELVQHGLTANALLYVTGSVLLGLTAVWIGQQIAAFFV